MATAISNRIIQAPMAGGPTTPSLVKAVHDAGALGFLAGGYLSPQALDQQIVDVGCRQFGVNLFVPESHHPKYEDLDSYRNALQPAFAELGVDLPAVPSFTDDSFNAKVDIVLQRQPGYCTFTFGLPDTSVVSSFQSVGIRVGITVTTPFEAVIAEANGADFLILQGPNAGGHSAQFDQSAEPSTLPLEAFIDEAHTRVTLPLVAAGGIGTPADAAILLERGVDAVQIGTRFLTSHEAGTKPCHRRALIEDTYTETTRTRAFSGRPARGLRNEFIDRFDSEAVIGYPQVNTLVSSLKKAAGDDAAWQNLWAGTGWAECREQSAAEIVREFSEYLNSHGF
ncbi:nitronate monooxygenase [Brevibacterium ravenspurgense]|uniref:NAD(P)H-dependent flavin oxidoreductase n=1 Tax=Brevibacterium ravenspurgense TaxID=479117 RepID=UPI001EF3D4DC|nr:nitronate monooxygenase [Brevibacterium ravenspurgense]MCG7301648.1 nitronate monooxygenase [Brevibacterium ravenspurgense]